MLCDKTSRTRTAPTQGWEAVQHSSITPGLIITVLSAHQRLIWLHVSCEAVMSGAQKRRQAWPEDMWTGFTHIVVSYKIPLRTCSASAPRGCIALLLEAQDQSHKLPVDRPAWELLTLLLAFPRTLQQGI